MLSERMTPMAGLFRGQAEARKVTLASWRMAWGNWRMSPCEELGQQVGEEVPPDDLHRGTPSFSAASR